MNVQHVGPKLVGVGVFAVMCVAIFFMLFLGAGGTIRVGERPYTVTTIVPDAFQLVENADVRRSGVKIGRVKLITNRGSASAVTIELDAAHAPLYRDAKIQLRTKTLVGENYLEIAPGSPRAGRLADGGTLPLTGGGEAVTLDRILSALDPRTRRAVQHNLDGLGDGFRDRGPDVNRLFAAMRPTVESGARAIDVLRAQRQQLAALIDDGGTLMQAFADRSEQVRRLATAANETAIAVGEREASLARMIDELPATLRQARDTVDVLNRFSRSSTPVLRDLRLAAVDLAPVMADLPPAAAAGRRLFAALPPFVELANPMFARLDPFARALVPAVHGVDAFVRQLQPALAYLAPYSGDLGSFFSNQGAWNNSLDALGARGRIFNYIDDHSYAAMTAEQRAAIDTLEQAGAVGRLKRFDSNAYPAPGTVGNPQPASGDYPRVRERP